MKKLLALIVCGFSYASSAAEPAHWQVDTTKSTIRWTANYGGKAITGTLPIASADIAFDPTQLATSHASVVIAATKLHSDDKDAQENLPAKDWFDVADFPQATFASTGFAKEGDHFTLIGTLTLRGKSAPVTVPFTMTSAPDNSAHIEAHVALKRTVFGIGQGDWAATDTVADEVQVNIILEAKHIAQ